METLLIPPFGCSDLFIRSELDQRLAQARVHRMRAEQQAVTSDAKQRGLDTERLLAKVTSLNALSTAEIRTELLRRRVLVIPSPQHIVGLS